jgi:hypothetical protein
VALDGVEHPPRRVAEGDGQQPPRLGHALAGAQVERHAGPAPVLDPGTQGDERLGVRVVRHAGLVAVAGVLAAEHVLRTQRRHRLEDLRRLVEQRLGRERRRRLHRDEAEDLEEVRDHHVAEGAGLLVKRRPAADRERLGHVDLHVGDVSAVPDRLVDAVAEAQGEQVLDRLLAQEVVDAEDLRLVEDSVDGLVECPRRGQVGAEGLLEDHARALSQARASQRLDDPGRRHGRNRQVVQAARGSAELALGEVHGRGQGGRLLVGVGVGQLAGEGVPLAVGRGAELVERLAGEAAEAVTVQGGARGPDDPIALGHETGPVEAKEAGQELASREVAGGAEEDDDVVGGGHAGQRTAGRARSNR